jgi:hypothetical protein
MLAPALAVAMHPVKLGPPIRLFNGKTLDGFETYLQRQGMNKDPEKVFTVEKGTVHVSGADYGYFVTKREFSDYYLSFEFKWGGATHPPRKDNARDSGVLYHVSGENKIWPKSIEFQMIEGGTGDIILVGGESVTVRGITKDKGRHDRFGKGEWKDVKDYRDPGREVEKPRGQWNKCEMWTVDGEIRYQVNGVLVNEGTGASARKGKILFQAEGAEVYFRKIILRPVTK